MGGDATMGPDDAMAVVIGLLARVAPEVDATTVDPSDDLRVAFDLDSMDFLSFVEGLAAAAGVDISESHYPQLETLSSAARYLAGSGP